MNVWVWGMEREREREDWVRERGFRGKVSRRRVNERNVL